MESGLENKTATTKKRKVKVMNEEGSATSATCSRQLDGQAANSQTQVGSRARVKNHPHLGSLWRATSRLLLLSLACVATLAGAVLRAIADDGIRFREASPPRREIVSALVLLAARFRSGRSGRRLT